MTKYPRETCINPPLESKMFKSRCERNDNCLSTVTIVNDLDSNMIGRNELVKELWNDHRVLVFTNRGHYIMDYDDKKKEYTPRGKKEASKQTKKLKPKYPILPDYIPDPNRCALEHGIHAYKLDRFVDDLERVLDEHGVEKTDLVGSSLGGLVSQAFAARHPERVERLALMKTFSSISPPIKTALRDIPKIGWTFMNWFGKARSKMIKEKDYGDYLPETVLQAIAQGIGDIDMTPYQKKIDPKKTETYIIRCPDDITWGTPVKNIKDAREEVLLFCGHVFNTRNPEMYDHIEDFLKEGREKTNRYPKEEQLPSIDLPQCDIDHPDSCEMPIVE